MTAGMADQGLAGLRDHPVAAHGLPEHIYLCCVRRTRDHNDVPRRRPVGEGLAREEQEGVLGVCRVWFWPGAPIAPFCCICSIRISNVAIVFESALQMPSIVLMDRLKRRPSGHRQGIRSRGSLRIAAALLRLLQSHA